MIQLNSISIVIPAYSEAESLAELINRIVCSLNSHFPNIIHELIVVNDGSVDDTHEILCGLSDRNNLRVITFRKNLGKSLALTAGFRAANGDVIVTMDADLQDKPEEIHLLVNTLGSEGVDFVSGWRRRRADSFVRKAGSILYNYCVRKITGINLHDFNSGFKAYKKELAKSMIIYGQYHRFLPVMAHFMGYRLSEVEITNDHRKHGQSKFNTFRYQGIFDLLSIVFLYRYALNPLYFFGMISFSIIIPSLLVIVYLTASHLISLIDNNFGHILISRPLFIGALFMFMTGVSIFLTGLICNLILHFSIKNNIDSILSDNTIK